MADRMFNLPAGHLERGVVELFGEIAIGATGAPTLSRGKGISSVTRNSAGQYAILLEDTYQRLLQCGTSVLHSTDSDPNSVGVLGRINSETVSNSSTPTVTIQFFDVATGADVDPANGAIVYVNIVLGNSTV